MVHGVNNPLVFVESYTLVWWPKDIVHLGTSRVLVYVDMPCGEQFIPKFCWNMQPSS